VAALDLADIQGGIVNGYRYPAASHLFFRVPCADAGRGFLRCLLDGIALRPAARRTAPKAVNVALTYAGLKTLEVTDAVLRRLPTAFAEPTEQRAPRLLGDTGANGPSQWNLAMHDADVLVLVYGNDQTLSPAAEDVCETAKDCGVEFLRCQPAHSLTTLENQREHFGFADGFGQPAVEGAPARRRAGQGTPQADGVTWRDLKAGEFILGYPDEDGQGALGDPEALLLRNGSYMVYRKLEQDVAAFEALLDDHAGAFGATLPAGTRQDHAYLRELLAAKLFGRWRDGMALEIAPQRSGEEVSDLRRQAHQDRDNDFRYAQMDADGLVCPHGAHVRRMNPRDALPGDGALSRRHRIIRRGMPYGTAWAEESTDRDRGLIFMCFNADLERQFELVQRRWVNSGNSFGLGDDADVCAGVSRTPAKIVIPGHLPYLLDRRQVVFTRGCQYFLMPGINALRDIAAKRPGLVDQ
jgi:Dyp-type peroxidase family